MWVCVAVAENPKLGLRSITRFDREKQPSFDYINSTVSPRFVLSYYFLHCLHSAQGSTNGGLICRGVHRTSLPFSSKTPPNLGFDSSSSTNCSFSLDRTSLPRGNRHPLLFTSPLDITTTLVTSSPEQEPRGTPVPSSWSPRRNFKSWKLPL